MPDSILLPPKMLIVRPFSEGADGKRVYCTPDGTLVCPHGECSGTISWWLAREKNARADGLPVPPRGRSVCDCQSTVGLNQTVPESARPSMPTSLFAFLEQLDTERVVVKGHDARRVPKLAGDAAFLTIDGKLVCRHGASRASLIKKAQCCGRSVHRPRCSCVAGAALDPFVFRISSAEV